MVSNKIPPSRKSVITLAFISPHCGKTTFSSSESENKVERDGETEVARQKMIEREQDEGIEVKENIK